MIWGEAHHLSRNHFVYTTDEDYDPPHSLPTYKDSGNEGTTVVKQPLCHSEFKRHFYIFQELRDIHPSAELSVPNFIQLYGNMCPLICYFHKLVYTCQCTVIYWTDR